MPEITIYTTTACAYCLAAKALLQRKGAPFREIDVTGDAAAREALMAKAGGSYTVPQIWIGAAHVGGSDDLHALDRSGKLAAMLAT